jgi:hypothetical protein
LGASGFGVFINFLGFTRWKNKKIAVSGNSKILNYLGDLNPRF